MEHQPTTPGAFNFSLLAIFFVSSCNLLFVDFFFVD